MFVYDSFAVDEHTRYRVEYYYEFPFENSIPCRINLFKETLDDKGRHVVGQSHDLQMKFSADINSNSLDVTFIRDEKEIDRNGVYQFFGDKVSSLVHFHDRLRRLKTKYNGASLAVLVSVLGYSDLLSEYGLDVRLFCEEDLAMEGNSDVIAVAGCINSITFEVSINLLTAEADLEVQKGTGTAYNIIEYLDKITPTELRKRLKICSYYKFDYNIFGTPKYYFV